jgi:TetR/AcrR family transcriptional regulator of autoinduction and epiphytic fitness
MILAEVRREAVPPTDGRRLRRENNREAVLDVLVDLFREGNYTPTSAAIATRAGLSMRSLCRYFDDFDDLIRAAIDRQQEQALALLDPGVGPDAPTAAKVDAIVGARLRTFDAIAPAARAARVCAHRQLLVRERMREARRFLRRQLATLFAAELAGRGPEVLAAMDVICSFESYELLRGDQGLSAARTGHAIAGALTALLDSGGRK